MEIHVSDVLIICTSILLTFSLFQHTKRSFRELRQDFLDKLSENDHKGHEQLQQKVEKLQQKVEKLQEKVEKISCKLEWQSKKITELILADSLDIETGRSVSIVTFEYDFLEQLIKTLMEDVFSLSGSHENAVEFRAEITKIFLFDSQPLSAAKRNMNIEDVSTEIIHRASTRIEMLFTDSSTPPQISELIIEIVKRIISLYFSMMTLDRSFSLWIEPDGTAFDPKRHRHLSDDDEFNDTKIRCVLVPGLSIFGRGNHERVVVKSLVVTN
jgi:hypothetical protein